MTKSDTLVTAKIPKDLHLKVKMEALKQGIKFKEATVAAFTLWLREMRSVAK